MKKKIYRKEITLKRVTRLVFFFFFEVPTILKFNFFIDFKNQLNKNPRLFEAIKIKI